MASWANLRKAWRVQGILLKSGFVCFLACLVLPSRADNVPPGDVVGAIEGEAISVEGPMSVEVVRGQTKTVLRSGSDVRVKSGQARVDLVEGGQIIVCGPAHFSVLKSGKALTIALEAGTMHAHLETDLALTVYTPLIQARPVSIGSGAQDVLVGLDSAGAMCLRANKGAVRIEQQLTGQSVLVPQNGDVTLANGQLENLRNTAGHCTCEMQQASKPATVTEVSVPVSEEEARKKAAEPRPVAEQGASAVPAEKQEPVYQVFMPPLEYEASAKVQPEYDPKFIVLVRRVRVRPTLIFQGRVEGDPVVAQVTPPPAPPAAKSDGGTKPDDSTWTRVRTFIRKLWSPSS